ncbi:MULTISPECIES: restriction endonuclease [Methanobacterium]|uniref:DUF3808 domain-containing protein n=1 Tax=Methanobacterium veterum TaxID=408577 RepID=A0A9E5A3W7_9EURY|nr:MULTISPECIES: restriction endonuclease [Methanobacterium]MCZ3366625.1 DUF3808 domain-containing protein [Methanobacterium veterum]MCZ3374230.1 DUF3808 domain-containing protein [Methanobacterium veterum]
MTSEKVKLPDEWKSIIGELTDKDFEYLCYELVRSMDGFTNVSLRDGSADGGRDIDAIYKSKMPDGITEIFEKCRFECKKYSNGISYRDISDKINKAISSRIEKIFIMSNMHLTPDCKDEIENAMNNFQCKIIDWTGVRFQDILFQYQDIFHDYFPDEKIPERFLDKDSPQELLKITQRAGSNFGMKFKLKINNEKNIPKSLDEMATNIKESLLDLKNIDLNIKSMIYQQMSGLFLSIKRREDALFFTNESLKITPNNIPVLLNKGHILMELGNLNDSLKCYNDVLKLDKQNKFALINKASILKNKGYFKKSLKTINEALSIEPNSKIAIHTKSRILRDFDRSEEALEFIDPYIKKNKNSKILLDTKITLLTEMVDLVPSMEMVNSLLDIYPEDSFLLNAKGAIYGINSEYQKKKKYLDLAEKYFDKALEIEKDSTEILANKLYVLMENKLLKEAESTLKMLMVDYPNDALILAKKGELCLKNKDFKKALKYFNKSLSRRYVGYTYLNKAKTLLLLRKYKDAIKITDEMLKDTPNDYMILEIKGKALERTHQNFQARKCLKMSKELKKEPISLLE